MTAGEACPNCGSALRIDTAVEIGHIFKLGYRYSESMGVRVLDRNGKEVMPIMGCYGIGIERILTAAVEQGNDENGFWLPPAIAPFEIVVAPVNVKDETVKSAAEDIANRLEAAGFDVILDDRDERPGVKFKDADLVGIPFRITVGKKVTEGTVEVVLRSTREVRDVTISAVVDHFQGVLLRPELSFAPAAAQFFRLWESSKRSWVFLCSRPWYSACFRWLPPCWPITVFKTTSRRSR